MKERDDLLTNTTRDESLWRFKEQIITNVYKTIEDLKTF